jgi:hypothetical protein
VISEINIVAKEKPSRVQSPHLAIYQFQKELNTLRKQWLELLGCQPIPGWKPPERISGKLQKTLSQLHANQKPEKDIAQACRQITAGGYLVGSALEWRQPSLGKASAVSETRGAQWRLTVAWAGLETLVHSTIGGLNCKHLEHLTNIAGLDETTQRLPPPSPKMRNLQQARLWPKTGDKPAMLEYIGTGKGFASEMLSRWLYEGKPLVRAHEQLGLAQSIRHATAHGALSSSCLVSWGMRPALAPLTAIIAEASVGIFRAILMDKALT